jgi:hypothetical protein
VFFVVLEYQVNQLHRVVLPALISMVQSYKKYLKLPNIFPTFFQKSNGIKTLPYSAITQGFWTITTGSCCQCFLPTMTGGGNAESRKCGKWTLSIF